MNALTITGNVVADPERVEYGEGKSLANLRIGNNELVNGESVSNGFFDVTVFGPQAEHVMASIKKGDRLIVSGRLQHSTYERQDGTTGGRTKLIAQAIGASMEFAAVGVSRKVDVPPAPSQ